MVAFYAPDVSVTHNHPANNGAPTADAKHHIVETPMIMDCFQEVKEGCSERFCDVCDACGACCSWLCRCATTVTNTPTAIIAAKNTNTVHHVWSWFRYTIYKAAKTTTT